MSTPPESYYDLDAPADLYLVSMAGTTGSRRVLWRMSTRGAMTVCQHPDTAGQNWMICWTQQMLIDLEAKRFAVDDGRFSKLFSELGVTVLYSKQMLESGAHFSPSPKTLSPKPAPPAADGQLGLFDLLEAS